MRSITVIDDDPDVLVAARLALSPNFDAVATFATPEEFLAKIPEMRPQVVLLDMNFTSGARSGDEGMKWLARIKAASPSSSVIMMTAYGDIAVAVQALKQGATDFVLKPWQNEKLIATVAAAALADSQRETLRLNASDSILANQAATFDGAIIGRSSALQRVLAAIRRAAPTDANILILGESGTGKDLLAREIHRLSPRNRQPFIAVDLGAITESLFESELFGHRRGAFTGATADRAGRIAAAEGGTLFLDEIGNLPPHLQSKLLTALERREIVPLGATKIQPIDIRLITATNRPAGELSHEGIFRPDLLFRIKTVEISMPPLRDRREDIPLLLDHYLGHFARKYNVPQRRPSDAATEALLRYAWPGNVRELRHLVERATILGANDLLEPDDFSLSLQPVPANTAAMDLQNLERDTIQHALARYNGNISQTAIALGLTRQALYRRMSKYGF